MHRAVDHGKDQSYVLGVLTQDQLAHSMFPLGDSTKPAVREEAARRGLLVADKPDSHDICFVADGDNGGWLREKLGDRAPNQGGEIVDQASGEVLGQHEGTFGFTIGQRKGLRIGRPAPDGKPRYVLDIEPVSGTVTVGPAIGPDRRPADRHQAALVRHGPRAASRAPSSSARTATSTARSSPSRGWRRGRGRAPRPRPGHRPRPGRRDLRRHPRRRVGHDLGHGAVAQPLVTPGYADDPAARPGQQ